MEQLTYYDKKRNEWIDSLEENEENDKNIENYENVADTGKSNEWAEGYNFGIQAPHGIYRKGKDTPIRRNNEKKDLSWKNKSMNEN